VLIYLLIVVNFQSWATRGDRLGAACRSGRDRLDAVHHGHHAVGAGADGAILCMGVATANSVLVVSFARERLEIVGDGLKAALEAATRFRPVLMTALAMIIGMGPMALGLGDGGEQNAPLGRAVIGGLIFATTATLIFVPLFSPLSTGAQNLTRLPHRCPSCCGARTCLTIPKICCPTPSRPGACARPG
jgi:multidrug efflux pump subunit AcrB